MSRLAAGRAIETTFRLREGYRIAGHSFTEATMVLLKLETDDGLAGFGCAAPFEEVTGESPAAALAALNDRLLPLAREAASTDPIVPLLDRAATAAPGAPAARAAFDMALHDLAARRAGLPLYRLLGAARGRIATSVTLGIEHNLEAAVARAVRWIDDGYFILKLKVGEDREADVALVRRLRERLGPGVRLRADANQGYDESDAVRFLREVAPYDLELLEQPVAAGDDARLRRVADATPIPIMADESLLGEADAARLAGARAVDLFNVKLMKCGGIRAGLAIARHAQAAGIGVMVGCNDESRISIAAGLHLALAAPAIDRADLDGHLDLQDDVSRGGFRAEAGWLVPLEEPGLGVSADF